MNIVHLQLSGGIGGISVLTRDLAKISENNNIFYFLFEGGVIADDMKKNGSPVHIENGHHFAFLSEAKKFTAFCKKNNADVIIAHTGAPVCRFLALYAKKHMKNTKLLVYFHSNAFYNTYGSKLKNFIDSIIEKSTFKACDYGVAISQSVKDSFIEKYKLNGKKIKTIYNGVDIKKFYKAPSADNSAMNIIYVGRILYVKGIHVLIKAISLLPDDVDINLKVVGAGDDDYFDKTVALSEKLGLNNKIEFTGPMTNVPKLLSEADIFIHPAIWLEGFGISIAEAMAAELPCIAFDLGAAKELIDNDINGFIVQEADEKHLADAILKAYNLFKQNKLQPLGKKAAEKAKKFTIENTLKNLESLY